MFNIVMLNIYIFYFLKQIIILLAGFQRTTILYLK